MKIKFMENQEDLINQIFKWIDEGQSELAQEEILSIENEWDQIEVLIQLSEQVKDSTMIRLYLLILEVGALTSALKLALAPVLALNPAYNLSHAFELVRKFAQGFFTDPELSDLDLDINRIGTLDSYRSRAFDLALALVYQLSQKLVINFGIDNKYISYSIYNLVNRLHSILYYQDSNSYPQQNIDIIRDIVLDLDHELTQIDALNPLFDFKTNHFNNLKIAIEALYQPISRKMLTFSDFSDSVASDQKIYSYIIDEFLYLQNAISVVGKEPDPALELIASVLWRRYGKEISHITLEGVDRITPEILAEHLAPYLQAFEEFTRVYARLTDQKFEELRIVQIHNTEPKIELGLGVDGIIREVNEVTKLGKRKDESELRKIEIKERKSRYEAEKQKNITDALRHQVRRDNILEEEKTNLRIKLAEAEKVEAEAQKAYIEVAKQLELAKREILEYYLLLASDRIDKLNPDLPLLERLELENQLAVSMMRINTNQLNMRIGWHDNPRPKSLPD